MKTFFSYGLYFIIFLFSCEQRKSVDSKEVKDEISSEVRNLDVMDGNNDLIEAKFVSDTISFPFDGEIYYTIENRSKEELNTDREFWVERLDKQVWKVLPFVPNLGKEDILSKVRPNSVVKFPAPIDKILEERPLKAGEYKICKYLWKADSPKDTIKIFANFTVK